jgi:DNA-binding MarR family transcriptional regulator
MMLGMLASSIISGQVISRTGRYRIFPIAGTAIMSVGLFLLSRLTVASSTTQASVFMLMLGLGMGMVMQVLVIAVQNDVDYRDLGVATSGATLFRLIGGSLGTAVLGAIFAGRLSANLSRLLPAGANPGAAGRGMSTQLLAQMPAAARTAYAEAFTASLGTVFLVATGVSVIGFALSFLLPERPLRETVAASARDSGNEAGGAFGQPIDADGAQAQLLQAFTALADRDVQRQHIRRIVERAGETLSPLAAWLLVQIERSPDVYHRDLTRARGVEQHRADAALKELDARHLTVTGEHTLDGLPSRVLTPGGRAVLDRLVAARRAHLAELLAEWDPGEESASEYLRNAVRELIPQTPQSA